MTQEIQLRPSWPVLYQSTAILLRGCSPNKASLIGPEHTALSSSQEPKYRTSLGTRALLLNFFDTAGVCTCEAATKMPYRRAKMQRSGSDIERHQKRTLDSCSDV